MMRHTCTHIITFSVRIFFYRLSSSIRTASWYLSYFFFFSSRRRHTRLQGDWSSDVCSSDLRAELLFGWRFDFAHEGVRRIGWLMAPALIGLSVTQINILVSTILASYFPGGPAYLFYGMRLIHFPLGIFRVALATALLPSLSTQPAERGFEALRGTLGVGLRPIFFIISPAMVGLILLRVPIVHLFFEHGRFTAAD